MAPSASSSAVLLLCLNLLLLAVVVTACPPPPSPPPPKPKLPPRTPRRVPPSPRVVPPSPKATTTCPVDTLKLAACDDVLGGLVNIQLGTPPKEPCCSLVGGLDDLEAAVCLCTVIKVNALGLNLNIPVDLTLLVNYCGKGVPPDYVCA
ncbi:putative lipid-binding protein AIR1 [Curcuma longa]|uniref:putative lipid-binding protein AIR1 n=1 Tax=Curcuma longa TaxID=136217 RepID=UPI003D9EAF42